MLDDTGQAVGVRLPCPTCRSNAHTKWNSWADVSAGVYVVMLKIHLLYAGNRSYTHACTRSQVNDAMLNPLCSAASVSSQPRAIHDVSGESIFLVASRQTCLNPECSAVKERLMAAMQKRDKGGEAEMLDKRKGGDAVDKAGDDVKAALRRGDAGKYMWATKKLVGAGVSFTISDSR